VRFTRTAIAYFGLLASVLLSHLVGDGRFISLPAIIAFSIIIIGALSISVPQELAGPHLALLVLVAQSLGHFIFGGGGTNASMTASHLVGGIIGYQLITRLDRVICSLESLLHRILIPLKISQVKVPTGPIKVSAYTFIARVKSCLRTPSYSLRAPPRYIVN
jgi:hypothetical protein